MAEPNTAAAQGNEPGTQPNTANNAGTAGASAEKTYTQAEIDRIVASNPAQEFLGNKRRTAIFRRRIVV